MTVITTALTWSDVLSPEKKLPYFQNIINFLKQEKNLGKTIYPSQSDIFNAISLTELAKVKVVILGQDPYHGLDQAHGLCFSVQKNQKKLPPSLKNIYKEISADCGIEFSNYGDLTCWAKQGVLLLNTVLTVEAGLANSHANIGWATFTDSIIRALNEHLSGVVFLLWGTHAQRKCSNIDESKHHILACAHPSPLSAHRGFFGCKHFSKTNNILQEAGKDIIDWRVVLT